MRRAPAQGREEAQGAGDGETRRNHAHERRHEGKALGERGGGTEPDESGKREGADRERADGRARPAVSGRGQPRGDPRGRGQQGADDDEDDHGEQELGRPQPRAVEPRVCAVHVLERLGRLEHAQPAVGDETLAGDPGREQCVSAGGRRERGGPERHESPG